MPLVPAGLGETAARCAALLVLCVGVDTTPAGNPVGSIAVPMATLEIGMDRDRLEQLARKARLGIFDRPCTPAEHDPTRWHPLVNDDAGCHYDHQHGDDPEFASDLFGVPGAWFGAAGQSVSYPWQTFPTNDPQAQPDEAARTGKLENQAKHEGYFWVVRRAQRCRDGHDCITDFRLQFHGMFMAIDAAVRFHSFSFEGRVCRDPLRPDTCGIVRTGGWADHGTLVTPNEAVCDHAAQAGPQIPLGNSSQFLPLNADGGLLDEMRCHPSIGADLVTANPGGLVVPAAEWWAQLQNDFRYQIRVHDPIGNVAETKPGSQALAGHFFCDASDPACRWNESMVSAFIGYTLHIWSTVGDVPVDRDGDQVTDMTAASGVFTTRFGRHAPDCVAASLDCVPRIYDGVHLNLNYSSASNQPPFKEARYSHLPCDRCPRLDYDITPPGRPSWISWYRRLLEPRGE